LQSKKITREIIQIAHLVFVSYSTAKKETGRKPNIVAAISTIIEQANSFE
jgi:hypothetical protein